MVWLSSTAIGIGAGLVVGYLTERLPVTSVLQSVGAAFVAMLVGSGLVMLIWFTRPAGSGGVFVGIGVDNILQVVGLCFLAAVLHVVLGRLGVPEIVADHRAIALGCAGGLYGALSVARAMLGLDRWPPAGQPPNGADAPGVRGHHGAAARGSLEALDRRRTWNR